MLIIAYLPGSEGVYTLNETAFIASLELSSSEPPAPTTATVEFTVDMNGVDQPSADYDNVVVNGSWNGWQGWGVQLSDEDGDGVFTGSLEVDPGTSFEYVVAVTGAADGWSGWGMQWGDGCANANVAVTAGDAGSVTSSSLTPGCADVVGCMDANASNYNADATVQGYDQWGNLQCVYASCDDIPEYGCIYADGFGAFNEGFDATACSTYGGTPCEEPVAEVLGCTDGAANNFNAEANIDDGSCDYTNTEPVVGFVFSGTFGGTVANANNYSMPSGSQPWAGLANEDVSAYPFTFGDGGSITFTGSTDGESADVYFRFEKNPYPDTEPSYNTELVSIGAESAEYTVNVPSQEGNTFSSFLLYVTTPDVVVTLNNVQVNTSEYSGPVDVTGCMDANASNYNADATVQGYDQWGNLQCVYASCDDIPEYGCIYADGFGAFNEGFDATACSSYGGTPCEEPVSGCTDGSANNFNSDANVDDGSCTYDVLGCTDETADNYNSDANVDDGSCEYPEPAVGTAIADCGDFAAGPNATWTHVLTATTIVDGAASQGPQTFTMRYYVFTRGWSKL